VALLREECSRQFLVDDAVFRSSTCNDRPAGGGEASPRKWPPPEEPQSPSRRRRLPEFRWLDRLEQIGRNADPVAARNVARLVARREHENDRTAQTGVLFDRLRQHESVDVRHVHIGEHQLKRLSFWLACRSASNALPAEDTTCGRMPRLRSASARIRRLVSLSSTTNTRAFPARCRVPAQSQHDTPRDSETRREVKPAASLDFTLHPDSPPIISTSRAAIANPRPVPP